MQVSGPKYYMVDSFFFVVSFVISLKVLSKEAAVEYEGKSWSLVKSELNNSQPDVREHFMFYLD